jgi:NAD(P)H-hydrate epimerase
MKVVSIAQMRALEMAARGAGLSEADLQQRAGAAVAREVASRLGRGDRLTVLVGHGNNGRDGAIAAEWLLRRQFDVDLVLAPRHALTAVELATLSGLRATLIPSTDVAALGRSLRAASVALDALTGIGSRGPLREPLNGLAAALNRARLERRDESVVAPRLLAVALDVPSGVDADTGAVPGEAVRADITVTLGGVKAGLLRFPAADYVGQLVSCEIGIPAAAEAVLPYTVLDEWSLTALLPERPLDSHKYRFGRVLAIAGSDHFPGAAVLCTGAAARTGAGLVTLAASHDLRLSVAAHFPEVTYTASDVSPGAGLAAFDALGPSVQSHHVVLLGPGLGRSDATTAFVHALLERRPREQRLVIDADGLVALAAIPEWQRLVDQNVVLTPHGGELARLLGHQLSESEPLWEQAGAAAREWGCVLVAKGPFSCIASAGGHVDVWPRANSALSTGGTGDVLAGVTAGFLAQQVPPWDAARLAVGVHGLAAARVVHERGWRTLLASDLVEELPAVMGKLERSTRRR